MSNCDKLLEPRNTCVSATRDQNETEGKEICRTRHNTHSAIISKFLEQFLYNRVPFQRRACPCDSITSISFDCYWFHVQIWPTIAMPKVLISRKTIFCDLLFECVEATTTTP